MINTERDSETKPPVDLRNRCISAGRGFGLVFVHTEEVSGSIPLPPTRLVAGQGDLRADWLPGRDATIRRDPLVDAGVGLQSPKLGAIVVGALTHHLVLPRTNP